MGEGNQRCYGERPVKVDLAPAIMNRDRTGPIERVILNLYRDVEESDQ